MYVSWLLSYSKRVQMLWSLYKENSSQIWCYSLWKQMLLPKALSSRECLREDLVAILASSYTSILLFLSLVLVLCQTHLRRTIPFYSTICKRKLGNKRKCRKTKQPRDDYVFTDVKIKELEEFHTQGTKRIKTYGKSKYLWAYLKIISFLVTQIFGVIYCF